jgi:hypothetical protein
MASVRRAKTAAIDRLEFSDVPEPGVAGAALLALQAAGATAFPRAAYPLATSPKISVSPV